MPVIIPSTDDHGDIVGLIAEATNDPAHSDYWRVNSNGRYFLVRAHPDDSVSNHFPGTVLDVGLPILARQQIATARAELGVECSACPKHWRQLRLHTPD